MSLKNVTEKIRIEMSGSTQRYMVSAKQGDRATRYVEVTLLDNGEEYQIPAGTVVTSYVRKPDRKKVYASCQYSGAKVTVALNSQTLAAAGTALCEVEAKSSDMTQMITSVTFEIEIEPRVKEDDAIVSSDEMSFFDKIMQQYAQQESARQQAEKNRATAESGRATAESGRVTAETGRVTAESGRVTAESARATAEAGRVTAEAGRVSAEAERQENAQEVLDKANQAILIASQINGSSYIEDKDDNVKYAFSIYAQGGVPHMALSQIEE